MVSVSYSETDRESRAAHLADGVFVYLAHDGYAPGGRERFRYVISDD